MSEASRVGRTEPAPEARAHLARGHLRRRADGHLSAERLLGAPTARRRCRARRARAPRCAQPRAHRRHGRPGVGSRASDPASSRVGRGVEQCRRVRFFRSVGAPAGSLAACPCVRSAPRVKRACRILSIGHGPHEWAGPRPRTIHVPRGTRVAWLRNRAERQTTRSASSSFGLRDQPSPNRVCAVSISASANERLARDVVASGRRAHPTWDKVVFRSARISPRASAWSSERLRIADIIETSVGRRDGSFQSVLVPTGPGQQLLDGAPCDHARDADVHPGCGPRSGRPWSGEHAIARREWVNVQEQIAGRSRA